MAGKRKILMVLTSALLMGGLAGCAENQIPDLGGEDIQAVGEYVAFMMMKYDINHRSRLMELAVLEESAPENPEATQEPSGMPPVADTPVVESEGKEEQTAPTYSLEEVLGLPEGVEVAFSGQEIHDNYPEEGEFFSLNASQGKKLLVLHFTVANTGAQEQKVDMLGSGAVFNVTVDGSYTRRALTTMLLDDMATYVGSVPAGESVNTVLVIEVEEGMADGISSASLDVKNEEKAYGCKLF